MRCALVAGVARHVDAAWGASPGADARPEPQAQRLRGAGMGQRAVGLFRGGPQALGRVPGVPGPPYRDLSAAASLGGVVQLLYPQIESRMGLAGGAPDGAVVVLADLCGT